MDPSCCDCLNVAGSHKPDFMYTLWAIYVCPLPAPNCIVTVYLQEQRVHSSSTLHAGAGLL